MLKITCGESISSGNIKSVSSPHSGNTGLSFSTIVSILTVETVTNSKKAVSTKEHLFIGWHLRILEPSGKRMAALEQSMNAWWNNSPWDHL